MSIIQLLSSHQFADDPRLSPPRKRNSRSEQQISSATSFGGVRKRTASAIEKLSEFHNALLEDPATISRRSHVPMIVHARSKKPRQVFEKTTEGRMLDALAAR